MKRMTKNIQHGDSEQVEKMLSNQGYYTIGMWYDRIDSVGAFIIQWIPLLIILFRLSVCLYYYPRSISYLLAHPLTELMYLFVSLGVYLYIALGFFLGTAIVALIIRRVLLVLAAKIYYRVYNELGINPPVFESWML